MITTLKRHPQVAHRALPLGIEEQEAQIAKDLYTVDRGVRYALPIDHVKRKSDWQHREIWVHDDQHGTHRKGVVFQAYHSRWQQKALAWARDHVHQDIPSIYYNAVLGHDLHVSQWANLYAKHWHAGCA